MVVPGERHEGDVEQIHLLQGTNRLRLVVEAFVAMRPISSDPFDSNSVALFQIAAAAEELDVVLAVAAPFGDGDDVVVFEVLVGLTLGAAAAVALPDALPHVSSDMPTGKFCDFLDDGLIGATRAVFQIAVINSG